MGYWFAGAALGMGLEAAGASGAFASQPGVPKLSSILDTALGSAYGSNPQQQIQLQTLQNKLAKATNPQQKKQLQNQINTLQTAIGNTSESGANNQFLNMLQSYYPQLAQQQQGINANANQFGLQQQNQFGLPVGQSIAGAQQQLNPQFYAGQQQLGNELFNQPLGLSPQQVQFFNNQLMGNQSAMGLGSSPLGAQNTALALTGLNLQQANTQLGQQQGFLNSYQQFQVPNLFSPEAALGSTSTQQLGGNSLSSISPETLLNLQSNLAGLKFAQGTQQANAINGAIGGVGSSLLGMAMGGGGGMMGGSGGFSSFFGGGGASSMGQSSLGSTAGTVYGPYTGAML